MTVPPPPFQAFLDSNRDAVYRFALAAVGPDEAEDVFQETFVAALRAYPALRGESGDLRAWVMTIARNKAVDAHRSRGRRALPVGDVPERPAAPAAEPQELWRHLEGLPPKQRTALLLRFAGDLRYRDIGAAIGSSEAAARQSVRAGLERLREAMA